MKTQNLIQASANVIKITELLVGDVVKIVDESYSNIEIKYGVVIDILNDGQKTFIQIAQYKKTYSDTIDCELKTYAGKNELNIFPTTPEEVKEYFQEALTRIGSDIEKKERELLERKEMLQKAKQFTDLETSKKLRATSFKEITQEQYNNRLKELSQTTEVF
jgi:hypothetical protein